MTAPVGDRDATTSFARTLVDEWVRGGVRMAALAPGSRSTPLALALASDDRIRLEVFLDERSAAFFTLGCARGDGRPAVVLSTSGTAAANFHPAVVEADHGRIPLIVCTADRPAELRDVGAGQTIDQTHLYGRSVRWFCDPGPPEDRPGVGRVWRSLAARSVCEATAGIPGPVHLNLPFHEPLVPTGAPLVEAPGRPGDRPWTSAVPGASPGDRAIEAVCAAVRGVARGVVVAGWGTDAGTGAVGAFAGRLGWPVLADPLSGLRTGADSTSLATVTTYDLLLRDDELAQRLLPDVVVQLGAVPTSKVAVSWLDRVARRIVVDRPGGWPDPAHGADLVVHADADELLAAPPHAWTARPLPIRHGSTHGRPPSRARAGPSTPSSAGPTS
ncbi:MAG: 2-succinyl-5-enolpyruvyl-6-hydroxy-3-cyclohexene-1-carboxylic-acid synthase [Acidimicrobiia bacterium]